MEEDFEQLRQHVWKAGLMKVDPWFYIAHFGRGNTGFGTLQGDTSTMGVRWHWGVDSPLKKIRAVVHS